MNHLDFVLVDIAILEAAKNALPPNSHTAALVAFTLYRLEEEADAMRRMALMRAA